MKRIVSLLAAAAVVAATLFVVVPFASARTAATTIKVTAKDFKFALSKRARRHGKGDLQGHEQGPHPARLQDRRQEDDAAQPRQDATLTVTLKKGKKYTYICTVPGHASSA